MGAIVGIDCSAVLPDLDVVAHRVPHPTGAALGRRLISAGYGLTGRRIERDRPGYAECDLKASGDGELLDRHAAVVPAYLSDASVASASRDHDRKDDKDCQFGCWTATQVDPTYRRMTEDHVIRFEQTTGAGTARKER